MEMGTKANKARLAWPICGLLDGADWPAAAAARLRSFASCFGGNGGGSSILPKWCVHLSPRTFIPLTFSPFTSRLDFHTAARRHSTHFCCSASQLSLTLWWSYSFFLLLSCCCCCRNGSRQMADADANAHWVCCCWADTLTQLARRGSKNERENVVLVNYEME